MVDNPLEFLVYLYDNVAGFAEWFMPFLKKPFTDVWYDIFGDGFASDVLTRFFSLLGLADVPLGVMLFGSSLGIILIALIVHWVFRLIDAINPL